MSFEPHEDPFGLRTDPARYVARPETERALDELERGVLLTESPVALFGPAGIGKTLLLRVLARRLATSFRAVHLPYPSLDSADLCRWALLELGEPAGDDPEGALVAEACRPTSHELGVLLLVDDADALPLETARRLTAMMRRCQGMLRVVMASADPERSLGVLDRAGADLVVVELTEPMSRSETAACLGGLLAGSDKRMRARFDATSMARLHEACAGVPGLLQAAASDHLRGAPEASPPTPEAAPPVPEMKPSRSVLAEPGTHDLQATQVTRRAVRKRRRRRRQQRILTPRRAGPSRRVIMAAAAATAVAGALAIGLVWPFGAPENGDPTGARASSPAALERRRPERIDVAAPPPVAAPKPVAVAPPASSPAPAPVPPKATAPPPETAPVVPKAAAPSPQTERVAVKVPTPVEPKLEPKPAALPAPAPEPEAEPAQEPAPTPSVAAAPPRPAPKPAPRRPAAPVPMLSVEVEAPAGASIEIDGRSLGEAPLANVRLPAGSRRVVVRLADGSVMQRTVQIEAEGQRIVFY